MNQDLTTGAPRKVLQRFCLPLFGSVLFQQLYNIADSLIAGKLIGENALAAVGNSYEITLIYLAFAFGCNIGCSVLVSRYFGARRMGELRTAASTSMICCIAVTAALMLFGQLLGEPLLRLINTPEEVMADSLLYLRIYTWGLPFVMFYNLSNGIFTALGDSRTPFRFLAGSSLSNIAVDILFVASFHMGVAGVAWATFLCQGVSCVLACLVVLKRLRALPREEDVRLFSGEALRQFIAIALPSTLQQSFISVGNIIIQSVINVFGPAVMAGYSAGIKLNNLVITSYTTMANGISNYTSQNLGAKKPERIPQGLRAGIQLSWMLTVPFFLLYFFFGENLVRLFLDQPTAVALDTGRTLLRILSPFYCVICMKIAADGVLRGASMMGRFMVSTFTDLVLRVVLAILFSGTSLGATGIWCAWPVGWVIAVGISLYFYWSAFERKNAACPEKTE